MYVVTRVDADLPWPPGDSPLQHLAVVPRPLGPGGGQEAGGGHQQEQVRQHGEVQPDWAVLTHTDPDQTTHTIHSGPLRSNRYGNGPVKQNFIVSIF